VKTTKTILLDVTQDNINKGCPGDVDACPIALAFRREGYAACVGHSTYYFYPYGGPLMVCLVSVTSLPMRRFILTFDSDKPVEPARFRVQVPAEAEAAK
jgi:hypothetical protein